MKQCSATVFAVVATWPDVELAISHTVETIHTLYLTHHNYWQIANCFHFQIKKSKIKPPLETLRKNVTDRFNV